MINWFRDESLVKQLVVMLFLAVGIGFLREAIQDTFNFDISMYIVGFLLFLVFRKQFKQQIMQTNKPNPTSVENP